MDFIYHDFKNRRGGRGKRIEDGKIRLHWKLNNKSICLNENASDKIRAAKLMYVRVREDRYTGNIVLVFNNETGLKLNPKRVENKCITIDSIDIAELVSTKLYINPPKDLYFTLDIKTTCIFESSDEIVFDLDKNDMIYQQTIIN